ncbi:MAG TPA: ABC transporter substrate-binding protein [Pseudolabrys sp.]|nr:ABC transporter substrate-binding protein [Pseudolabrys sp.]
MLRREWMKSAVAAALAVPLLMVAGAGRAAEVGVTDATIKIGILSSLTGPGALFGSGNEAGAVMAFEEVNAAGGINGRKLEWVSLDDETSPPKAIIAFRRLVDQEKVFAVYGPSASAIAQALVPSFKQAAQVPVFIGVPSSPSVTHPLIPNVFRTGPINDLAQGVALADYVLDNLKAKKIAIIRQTDEYGKRGAEGFLSRLKERNAVAVEQVFGIADTDFTAQVASIAKTEPDVLIIYGYPNPSALITRQARQFGMKATIVGSNAANSRVYPQVVGNAAIGAQNIITFEDLPESGMDPRMVRFRDAYAKRFPEYARQNRPDLADTLAYGSAQAFIEGLKRAGKNLTRPGFIAALETLNKFETGITLPTTFTAKDHEGNKSSKIFQIQEDLTRKLLPTTIQTK